MLLTFIILNTLRNFLKLFLYRWWTCYLCNVCKVFFYKPVTVLFWSYLAATEKVKFFLIFLSSICVLKWILDGMCPGSPCQLWSGSHFACHRQGQDVQLFVYTCVHVRQAYDRSSNSFVNATLPRRRFSSEMVLTG